MFKQILVDHRSKESLLKTKNNDTCKAVLGSLLNALVPHRAARRSTGTQPAAQPPNLLLLVVLCPCSSSSAELPPVDGKTSSHFGVRAAASSKKRDFCQGGASLVSNMGFRSPWGISLSLLPATSKFLETWNFLISLAFNAAWLQSIMGCNYCWGSANGQTDKQSGI